MSGNSILVQPKERACLLLPRHNPGFRNQAGPGLQFNFFPGKLARNHKPGVSTCQHPFRIDSEPAGFTSMTAPASLREVHQCLLLITNYASPFTSRESVIARRVADR